MEKSGILHAGFTVWTLLFCTTISSGQTAAQQPPVTFPPPAQLLATTFQKTYGGAGNEAGNYVIETGSGYLVAGYTSSFGAGGNDAYLLQVDFTGNFLWQKTYGGTEHDAFYAVVKANDDGFVALGNTESYGNHTKDVIVVKTDINGTVQWSHLFDGGKADSALSLLKLDDGYVISGITEELFGPAPLFQPFAFRLNNNGTLVWEHKYPIFSVAGAQVGGATCVNYAENNELFVSGLSSDGNACFYKINPANGSFVAVSGRRYGGISTEALFHMRPTFDGNLVLADHTFSASGGAQMQQWVCKTDKNGNPLWSKVYSKPGANLRGRIENISDSSFLLVPREDVNLAISDGILAKIDQNGVLQWAKKFGGPDADRFFKAQETSDLGFIAVGHTRSTGFGGDDVFLVKTNDKGIDENCCDVDENLEAKDFNPEMLPLAIDPISLPPIDTVVLKVENAGLDSTSYCSGTDTTITLCPGDSIVIGGVVYYPPATVTVNIPGDGCITYHLELAPQPTIIQTIQLCPGDSINLCGNSYAAPATVTCVIPASVGCDTLATYILELAPQPTVTRTITLCPGESVTICGATYTMPTTVTCLIPASTGCDTLATYILQYKSSDLSITCPSDITVTAPPGANTVVVNYAMPTAATNCPGGAGPAVLYQGLPSGSAFPLDTTDVCYAVEDTCCGADSCCFKVIVESPPCDVKTCGCLTYELLGITINAAKRRTYRIRVTNNCPNKLIYAAFQLPNGLVATDPPNNSVYTTPAGREYDVRNPNFSPFYSIRFKTVMDSINNGESDIFQYTLPAQASPDYIHVVTRVYPKIFCEAYLNTFNCVPVATPNIVQLNQQTPQNLGNEAEGGEQRNSDLFQPGSTNGQLVIYPNPTNGLLFVDLSYWKGQDLSVSVLNSQGQRVAITPVEARTEPYSLEMAANLPNGLYFLEVTPAGGVRQLRKFVLQR